jgi:pimeloyl-ACP methyl ester carboxylesterase
MLGALAGRYRVSWIEAIGCDPHYPVTDGWPRLVDQLLDALHARARGEAVIGVGHSLGGYLTFLAAVRRPEQFRAIVLLDAPIIGAFRGGVLAAVKRLGLVDRVTPAGASRDRRSVWAGREEAKAHFRTRRLFRHFDARCLDDYVRHGLVEDGHGGLRLLIDPGLEAQIYRTFPHGIARLLPALRVPAGFIGGTHSDVVRRFGLAPMRGRFAMRSIAGGHLFPLERPLEAAAAIESLLGELRSRGGAAP